MEYKIFMRTEKCRDISHETNEDKYLYMEYSFMNDEKIRVIVVADGMGGLEYAEKTSFDAVQGFSEALYQQLLKEYLHNTGEAFSMTHYAERMKDTVRYAIRAANKNVCEKAVPFARIGATLSVLAVIGDYAVIANVGDSPIYYYCSDTEEFGLVSRIQTKAEQDVEAGLYERFSEQYYSNDHIVLKSLGEKEELTDADIYIKTMGYLHAGDLFLVGTDGAFGRMDEKKIWEIIAEPRENTALKRLFEKARKDKDDDQTAVLYKVWRDE